MSSDWLLMDWCQIYMNWCQLQQKSFIEKNKELSECCKHCPRFQKKESAST